MKKMFIILVLTLSIKAAISQAGVPDTLAYLNSIAANKAFFIGKPFSVLADSLKIKIKYFTPFGGIHYNATLETSTSLSFYFPQDEHEIYLIYPKLKIFWQHYLNKTQSTNLFKQYHGGWLPDVGSFYASGIIADIDVRE